MNYEYSELSDLDIFYYYGEEGSNLEMETQSDILAGLIQPKRTMFYNRQDSSGVPEKENFPNSFILEISMKYNIANWVSFRNTKVSDGANGTPERRVAVSQDSIAVNYNNKGETNVNVQYIPFANINQKTQVTIPL